MAYHPLKSITLEDKEDKVSTSFYVKFTINYIKKPLRLVDMFM